MNGCPLHDVCVPKSLRFARFRMAGGGRSEAAVPLNRFKVRHYDRCLWNVYMQGVPERIGDGVMTTTTRRMLAAGLGLLMLWLAPAALADDKVKSRHPGDGLLGEWWTEGREGRIRFTRRKDGSYVGSTTCCKDEKDVNNPKPEMRSRSTLGIIIIWNLKYTEDGEFEDGYVYNPRDGNTYRMDVEIIDENTIEARGYLGVSLFGQTQTWKRAKLGKRGKVGGPKTGGPKTGGSKNGA